MTAPSIAPPAQRRFDWRRAGQIAAILFLALVLRAWAAWQLPVDADEPTYIAAAAAYRTALRDEGLSGLGEVTANREHPALVKVIDALAGGMDDLSFSEALRSNRVVSLVFGLLTVGVLAWVDPLAGLLLALHSLQIKYTAQGYLEAVPQFTSLLMLVLLSRVRGNRDLRLWLAAVLLGATAAGKLPYLVLVIPAAWLLLRERRMSWQLLPLWLGLAVLVFVVLNPLVWQGGWGWIERTLAFHRGYPRDMAVVRAGYGWLQGWAWLLRSYPAGWHGDVFFWYPPDGLITLLALPGVFLTRRQPWLAVWLAAGLAALLLWPVKWPQYTLLVIPVLCLLAASALRAGWGWLREQDNTWNLSELLLPHPPMWVKVLGVVIILAALLGQSVRIVITAIQQQGWWHVTQTTAPLPSNQISALLQTRTGEVLVGTPRGLVAAKLEGTSGFPVEWNLLSQGQAIHALAEASNGEVYAATANGLAEWRGGELIHVPGTEGAGEIYDLAIDGDAIWCATARGFARYSQGELTEWRLDSDLDQRVRTVAVQRREGQSLVYLGNSTGLWVFDSRTDTARRVPGQESGLGNGGIAELRIDNYGRLWVASLGGGLAILDHTGWHAFTITNSDLPFNTVTALGETNNWMWVGVTPPTEVGAQVLAFKNGEFSHPLLLRNGYSGSDSLSILGVASGQLWIGTRNQGIDIYRRTP